jgi:hypothetical protein
VTARLRKELGIDVQLVHGRYGEFKVLIDDKPIIDGGALAFLGILPSTREIIATVRDSLPPPDEEGHAA